MFALAFTTLLVIGSATPVQAASKKEKYSEYTTVVLLGATAIVARDMGLEHTSEDIAMVNRAVSDPWMFASSSKICKTMGASKTSAARKRTRAAIVDYLSDTALEELYAIEFYPDLSDGDKYFIGSVIGAQFTTVITAAGNVLCPKQARHVQPMVDAYMATVE